LGVQVAGIGDRDREGGIHEEVESIGTLAVSSEQESEDEEVERVLEVAKNTLGATASASTGAAASGAVAGTAGAVGGAGASTGAAGTAAGGGAVGGVGAVAQGRKALQQEALQGDHRPKGVCLRPLPRGSPSYWGARAERFGQRPVSAGGLRQRRGEAGVEGYVSEGEEDEGGGGEDGNWFLAAPGGAEYARSPERKR